MPIKDFEGRARIPRIGKIRLGEKVKGAKSEYPKAVDYFVCPPEVKAVYGEKPKKLNITFHSDSIDEIFPQYYKRYGKSTGLVCRGDGEMAVVINPETKEFEEIECHGRDCQYWKNDQCKTIGNLYFIVIGVNRFGVYQLDTSSYNSILNINGGLKYAKELTRGKLAMIPFILEIIPQEVNPEGKKKTVYVLRLEANIAEMLKSMKANPGDILQITKSKPESVDIEEDLYPKNLVESMPVTIEELRDMWIKVSKLGKTKEEFKEYLIKEYKIKESSKELTRKQFDKVMEKLREEQDKKDKEAEEVEQAYEEAEQKGLI
jgi:gas vesicle protein